MFLVLASLLCFDYIIEAVELRIHLHRPAPSIYQAGTVCNHQINLLRSTYGRISILNLRNLIFIIPI
jgi:hypothetical protein